MKGINNPISNRSGTYYQYSTTKRSKNISQTQNLNTNILQESQSVTIRKSPKHLL